MAVRIDGGKAEGAAKGSVASTPPSSSSCSSSSSDPLDIRYTSGSSSSSSQPPLDITHATKGVLGRHRGRGRDDERTEIELDAGKYNYPFSQPEQVGIPRLIRSL